MALGPVPIKRDAFLYIEGEGDKQCGTCWLYSHVGQRCAVLGKDFLVHEGDSCGYWGYGKQVDSSRYDMFTPEEVGFVRREVRCENCFYYKGIKNRQSGVCGLFDKLNENKDFNLNIVVKANGCCNAQTPRRERVVS